VSSDSEEDDDDDDDEDEDNAAAASKKGKAPAPSKRKKPSGGNSEKPQKRSRFIDDIAEAADDGEEDDDEDEDGGVGGLIADDDAEAAEAEADAGAAAARAQARALKQRDDALTAEQLEQMVRERYGSGRRAGGAGDSDDDGDGGERDHLMRRAAAGVGGPAAQQARLPTHEDPKLWLLESRGGQEREAVMNLLQKMVDCQERKLPPLGVTAAFAQDHLKGYFYVEAHKEAHVLEAVRGMRAVLFSKKPKLVPLREMTDALAAARPAASPLQEGGWARVRAGAYKGDLCRIAEVEPSSGRIKVRLVPRLDYAALFTRQSGNAPPAGRFGRGGGDGNSSSKMRPPPRAFSHVEARQHNLLVQRKNSMKSASGSEYLLEGLGPFIDGYLVKDVSARGLVPVSGVPPLDEVQKFVAVGQAAADAAAAEEDEYEDDEEEDEEGGSDKADRQQRQRRVAASAAKELAALLNDGNGNAGNGNGEGGNGAANAAAANAFVKGDKVEVTEGDLQGLFGRVLGTAPDGLRVLVKPVGEFDDIEPQPIEPSALKKRFEAGDHVKVLRGAAAGTTGLVVRVEDNILVFLSDAGREEVKVFVADVAESAEVASGLDACGEWELHDFVALDGATVGVIVGLDARAVRVLTNAPGTAAGEPDVRSCRSADFKRKLNARQGSLTSDKRGAAVSAGDLITLDFEGDRGGAGSSAAAARYSGKSATVKLVHRQHLFVHCREVAENGGFLCVRGRQVVLKSGAGIGGGDGGGGGHAPAPFERGGMHLPLKSPAPHRFGGGGGFNAPRPDVLSSPAPHQFGAGSAGPGFAPRSAAAPTMGGAGGLANSAGGAGGGRGGRGGGGHSSLVGRRITVAKGHLRGYVGRVLSVTETHARLEMEATTRTVTVALTALRPEDVGTLTTGSAAVPQAGAAGAGAGFPAGLEPGRTPLHQPAGGATPIWGAGGGAMMGGATPMHSSSYGGAAGGATPGGAWGNAAAASGARSPAWGGPMTGATPQEPTPLMQQQTPGGGGWGATPYGAGGGVGGGGAHATAPTPVGGAWGQAAGAAVPPPPPSDAPPAPPQADPSSSSAINYESWVGGVVVLPGGGLGVVTQAGGAGGASLAVVDAVRFTDESDPNYNDGRVSLAPGASAASSRWVAAEDVTLARPVKGDLVTILRGPHAGEGATLIGLHANDGIVRTDGGGEVTVVDVSCLAIRVAF